MGGLLSKSETAEEGATKSPTKSGSGDTTTPQYVEHKAEQPEKATTEQVTKDQPEVGSDQPEREELSNESAVKETEPDQPKMGPGGKPKSVCDTLITEALRNPLPVSPCVDSRASAPVQTREHSDLIAAGKLISDESPSKDEAPAMDKNSEVEVKASSELVTSYPEKKESLTAECVIPKDVDVDTKDVAAQDEMLAPVEVLAEQLSNVVITSAAKELGSEHHQHTECEKSETDVKSDLEKNHEGRMEECTEHNKMADEEQKKETEPKVATDVYMKMEVQHLSENSDKEPKIVDTTHGEQNNDDVIAGIANDTSNEVVTSNN